MILALAVFYAWYMVAWGENWLDPDPLAVQGALVGLMFASLLMSVAIGDAFAETAEDAGAVALWGTWTLTLIVLGLIAIAVADELAIAHPGDDATVGFRILAFGVRRCSCSRSSCSTARRSDMPHDHA